MILMALWSKASIGQTPTQLSQTLGLTYASVCMSKTKLVDEGLVEEHFPLRDKRSVKLYLTPKGRKESERAWEAIRAVAQLY